MGLANSKEVVATSAAPQAAGRVEIRRKLVGTNGTHERRVDTHVVAGLSTM
jgi:hypothetical protein